MCYHNLAIWGGRSYWNIQEMGDFVQQVVQAVEEAVRRVNIDLGRGARRTER